jgi:dTMP kinase
MMTTNLFYGVGFPYRNLSKLKGKLIVIEGTDGVGRTKQIEMLRNWLEGEGYAVADTGLSRSEMTGPGLDAAKSGHTLAPITKALFYAADFAERTEKHIIPALQAGFIVLADRYFYSMIARDSLRGVDREWLRKLYGIALRPDLILYLRASVPSLAQRLIHGRGLNYWESGMDLHLADNIYDSFVSYQTEMITKLEELSREYNFVTVNADRIPEEILADLQKPISCLLENRLGKEQEPF